MGIDQEVKPEYGLTNPTSEEKEKDRIKRFGSVIGLKPEKEQYYRKLHADTWPSVVKRLKRSNVQNFSIYVTELEGRKYLFSHFEYTGKDFDKDMKLIGEDPETKRWWKETDPCQIQLPTRKPGANWSEMEMVFLMD